MTENTQCEHNGSAFGCITTKCALAGQAALWPPSRDQSYERPKSCATKIADGGWDAIKSMLLASIRLGCASQVRVADRPALRLSCPSVVSPRKASVRRQRCIHFAAEGSSSMSKVRLDKIIQFGSRTSCVLRFS